MKRSYLYTGIVTLMVALLFGIVAALTNTKLESLLWGFTGGALGGGGSILWKYFYWSRPKNKNKYEERLENETIELQDERKEKLRNQSGRYAYIWGLAITGAAIVIFSVLGALEIIQHTRVLILYLCGYVLFQYVIGIVIFRHLNKKY